MKSLLYGILALIVIGVSGFVYRNAVEYRNRPIACPLDARVCPDGTTVGRVGLACEFPACPPPNISLPEIGIHYAIPEGFSSVTSTDEASVAAYEMQGPTPSESADIVIRQYAIGASTTAIATIRETAIGGASGMPVPATAFTSSVFGSYRFTVVSIERFEAVIHTAYYLARSHDVLRFDAIDRGVMSWSNPSLDIGKLPAHAALKKLLSTLEGGQ